ncbi:RHS repeat domain-containing protein [Pseudomonas sichuanensis]|uniref:RHS repeat-associated core domain-containing protein n=1 Tax=Pseudomonas sichuanensis TaxID=2213015 RepID=A0ABV0DB66_9PSED
MSANTVVHSKAFNFMSFLQHGVDPRTGQYTLSFDLPDIRTNALQGPALQLTLFFNPLNTRDSGYGKGWNLQLSQLAPGTQPGSQIVTLHSGESFLVKGKDPHASDGRLYMPEQKLDSFHLLERSGGANNWYQIEHRSGLLEKLEPVSGSSNLHLTTEVWTRQTRPLKLNYSDFVSEGVTYPRLASVQGTQEGDEYRPLLTLERDSRQLRILFHPSGPASEQALFVLHLDSQFRVEELVLPATTTSEGVTNQGKWRFSYTVQHNDFHCISRLSSPTGAQEIIDYDSDGHRFSNGMPGRLPRVSAHEIRPRHNAQGAPDNQFLTYNYTLPSDPDAEDQGDYSPDNNFLGANITLTAPETGLDILYTYEKAYRYGTVETLHDHERLPIRTIERHFNKLHLLTREKTTRGPAHDKHVHRVETTYHYQEGVGFEQQSRYCQLPLTTTTTWRRGNASRSEVAARTYHDDGNLHTERQPNGILETSEWYRAEGEPGCPADPGGFNRHLKSKTITPAAVEDDQHPIAPRVRDRYTYIALPGLESDADTHSWHVVEEKALQELNELGELRRTLQTTVYAYHDANEEAFLLGRLKSETVTLEERPETTTTTLYEYQTATRRYRTDQQADERALEITATVIGHDKTEQRSAVQLSLLTGEQLLLHDEEGVEIAYQYDVLGRLINETVAPGSDVQAERKYDYKLCASDDEKAEILVISAQGVRTRIQLDGLERTEEVQRDHVDDTQLGRFFTLERTEHDSEGRKTRTDQLDYDGARQLNTLSEHRFYDLWGQQNCVRSPDRTEQHTLNHLERASVRGSWAQESWRQAEDGTQCKKQRSWLNAFGKPDRIEQRDGSGDLIATQRFEYDGLGNCVVQYDARGNPTRHFYDPWGRATQVRPPDHSRIMRRYAAHSSESLPTAIEVIIPGVAQRSARSTVLGTRYYDGIGRLVETTTGQRKETLTYASGRRLPETRLTAAGKTVEFVYDARLNDSPIETRPEAADPSRLEFNKLSSTLESAINEQGTRRFGHDWDNRQTSESWTNKGESRPVFSSTKRFSLRGLLLTHDAEQFESSHLTYDEAGRLQSVQQGALAAHLAYDAMGRPATYTIQETASATPLSTTIITYDEHDREITRTFSVKNQSQHTLIQRWGLDDLPRQRTLMAGETVLRVETFGYDSRKRLTSHKYQGAQLPKDSLGRNISMQHYTYDHFDNLKQCRNDFDDGRHEQILYTAADDDPNQLKDITYLPPRDQAALELQYTVDGHLQRDHQGRNLEYDVFGRLLKVTDVVRNAEPIGTYRYDALGHLLSVRAGDDEEALLVFEENRLSFAIRSSSKSQWLRANDMPLAQQSTTAAGQPLLLHTDTQGSVIAEGESDRQRDAWYASYGSRSSQDVLLSQLGFNGEFIDPATGWYLLGSGYRVYNAELMRFHSPDSLSPFEAGGLTSYGYAQGNPITFRDPTGHAAQGFGASREVMMYSPAARSLASRPIHETDYERLQRYAQQDYEREVARMQAEALKKTKLFGAITIALGVASLVMTLGFAAFGVAPIGLGLIVATSLGATSVGLSSASLSVTLDAIRTQDPATIALSERLDWASLGASVADLAQSAMFGLAAKFAMRAAMKSAQISLRAAIVATPRTQSLAGGSMKLRPSINGLDIRQTRVSIQV